MVKDDVQRDVRYCSYYKFAVLKIVPFGMSKNGWALCMLLCDSDVQ